MNTISLITINGCMFFVDSSYPKDSQHKIEEIARKMAVPPEADDSDIFNTFLSEVQAQIGVNLQEIRVTHVFGINR